MTKEKWQEKADDLIDIILDLKEKGKRNKEDLDSAKMELIELLEDYGVSSNEVGMATPALSKVVLLYIGSFPVMETGTP